MSKTKFNKLKKKVKLEALNLKSYNDFIND